MIPNLWNLSASISSATELARIFNLSSNSPAYYNLRLMLSESGRCSYFECLKPPLWIKNVTALPKIVRLHDNMCNMIETNLVGKISVSGS